ncbi:hypothetical protein ABEB36_015100 [Hypothenemus hampei]|uniref:Uncharacterized protein n=1 Tax=Hypothenemus hampei TaxID=57062 RepID=A0ABD1E0E2_HYPHA
MSSVNKPSTLNHTAEDIVDPSFGEYPILLSQFITIKDVCEHGHCSVRLAKWDLVSTTTSKGSIFTILANYDERSYDVCSYWEEAPMDNGTSTSEKTQKSSGGCVASGEQAVVLQWADEN